MGVRGGHKAFDLIIKRFIRSDGSDIVWKVVLHIVETAGFKQAPMLGTGHQISLLAISGKDVSCALHCFQVISIVLGSFQSVV